jgi:hypothetical protein
MLKSEQLNCYLRFLTYFFLYQRFANEIFGTVLLLHNLQSHFVQEVRLQYYNGRAGARN